MKSNHNIIWLLAAFAMLGDADAHSRGFGGYHGGFGGFHSAGFGYTAGEFRGYHGGFGVGGMYEGALDGPRGFSGYGTNWSGFRGGYGLGTARGYQGGFNLGYRGAGGLPGYDDNRRPGPWSRGVAGWRGELGTGRGYVYLGYGPSSFPVRDLRPSQYGALSRIPGYVYGPAGERGESGRVERPNLNSALPTDLRLHEANGLEHGLGYLGDARGLTAFDPAIANAPRPAVAASQRIAEATHPMTAVTNYRPAADLRRHANIVRREMIAEAAFGPSWYDDYAGAWIASNIVADLWTPAAWTTVNNWFNTSWLAVGYNYGNEITYDNGNVNLYGVPIATAAEYFNSAAALAAKGKPAPPANVAWLPLGVFGAVRGGEKTTNMMFQLAVDKAGVIRGNYFNIADKNAQQIEGAVDKKTQRVTWIVEDRANIIFDTGLYNLTKDEFTVLVHFGKDKAEQWTLVRVKHTSGQPAQK